MTAALSGVGPPASTRVITPSVTCTSASRGPSGPWTVPPRISSSVKFQVLNAKERRVRDAGAFDVVLAPFASVEHDDQVDDVGARVTQHLRRTKRVAAGRHHVFDEGDPVFGLEAAFDLLRGPVPLRFLAHEDQRQPGLQGDGPAKQDGAKLRRREALGVIRNQCGEMLAQPAQKIRLGLEEKLVEVSIRPFARAKNEIAFEI